MSRVIAAVAVLAFLPGLAMAESVGPAQTPSVPAAQIAATETMSVTAIDVSAAERQRLMLEALKRGVEASRLSSDDIFRVQAFCTDLSFYAKFQLLREEAGCPVQIGSAQGLSARR
jgi:hypothetical protein